MKKVWIIVCLVLITLIGVRSFQNKTPLSNLSSEGTLPVKFFEPKAFYDGLPSKKINYKPFNGAIVPHHLVAGTILGDIFYQLKRQNPETIIIIGPNHYEVGNALVISSRKDWKNEFGTITVHREILDDLYDRGLVVFNDEVMVEEHSTQGMMPYISYFTPQSRVVPLVISGLISRKKIEEIADALEKYVRDGAAVIAAVDFSHHLMSNEAQKRDRVTLDIMKNRRIDELLRLNSEYLDSPASIALLMILMEKIGHTDFTLLHHTNSGILLGDESKEVTSYISGLYR